jgi:phosphoribosylanthranilate isomerase
MPGCVLKAAAVENLTDARYFAAREVQWLGFCLDPDHEAFVSPQLMMAIREWVDGVTIVGEFGFIAAEQLRQQVADYDLQAIQVGMHTTREDVLPLIGRVQIHRLLVVEPHTTAAELRQEVRDLSDWVNAVVLSFRHHGFRWHDLAAGHPISLDALRALCAIAPVMVDIDLDARELPDFLAQLPVYGLCVHGGSEEKTGFKSFDDLDDFFEVFIRESGH